MSSSHPSRLYGLEKAGNELVCLGYCCYVHIAQMAVLKKYAFELMDGRVDGWRDDEYKSRDLRGDWGLLREELGGQPPK